MVFGGAEVGSWGLKCLGSQIFIFLWVALK
jgi:hypothetical protein